MNENFTITRQQNYKDYERIMFCLKALGNDSDPAFTHYLHVENGRTGRFQYKMMELDLTRV